MQTYLEKHIPAKNVARFYRLAVLPNLFGEWTLVREWGRIGQGGRIRLDCFATHEQAFGGIAGAGSQEAAMRFHNLEGCLDV